MHEVVDATGGRILARALSGFIAPRAPVAATTTRRVGLSESDH
jgi:hypothetical protein